MSRLIVVSNRVAAGEDTRPSAGGLAVGVMDALKETGGVWFGWNGEIVDAPDTGPQSSGTATSPMRRSG